MNSNQMIVVGVVFSILILGVLSNASFIERIRRISQVHNDSWSYLVSVETESEYVCLGCFIGDKIILTSSKCIQDVSPDDISIKLSSSKWSESTKHRIVKSIYDINGLHEDLAILFLDKPVDELKLNNVTLKSYKTFYGGKIFHWSLQGKMNSRTAITGHVYESHETPGTFTATSFPFEKCFGDLGSPLIITHRGGHFITGILNDKILCSDNGFRNTFIDIGFYEKKIKAIINSHGNDEEQEPNEYDEDECIAASLLTTENEEDYKDLWEEINENKDNKIKLSNGIQDTKSRQKQEEKDAIRAEQGDYFEKDYEEDE